jgi:hypothetical protein
MVKEIHHFTCVFLGPTWSSGAQDYRTDEN